MGLSPYSGNDTKGQTFRLSAYIKAIVRRSLSSNPEDVCYSFYNAREKMQLLLRRVQGRRKDSALKGTSCSSRQPRFGFQHSSYSAHNHL